MDIGIPKEIKPQEGRVALMPIHVSTLTSKGHRVVVEQSAGLASGATDQAYKNAGAEIVVFAKTVYANAEMITKVKEIMPEEYGFFTL